VDQETVLNYPRLMSKFKSIPGTFLVSVVGIGAVALLFWRLGQGTLERWDEAAYARIAREMVLSGDWLTPHWNYEIYFDKPPLMMWITAAFFWLFGISEFWVRAASAVCGVGTAIVTFLIAVALYGRTVGLTSIVILATSKDFVWSGRVGMLDMPLTLLATLAVYGYIRLNSSDQRWWYLIWAAFGLAIMTKHAAAVIIPGVIVLAVVLDRNLFLTIRSPHFWIAIGLAALVALPWHFLMLIEHGRNFFDEYVMYRILWNTTRDAFGRTHSYSSSFSFLIETFQQGFRPWLFLTPFALILAAVEIIRGQSRSRLLVLEIIFVSVFFTSTAHPFPWYLLPIYPSLAILVAAVIVEAIRSPMSLSFWGVA
jgi:4-amino-4-deoxy-L-arabinose transferase-like glycosyltransferase